MAHTRQLSASRLSPSCRWVEEEGGGTSDRTAASVNLLFLSFADMEGEEPDALAKGMLDATLMERYQPGTSLPVASAGPAGMEML